MRIEAGEICLTQSSDMVLALHCSIYLLIVAHGCFIKLLGVTIMDDMSHNRFDELELWILTKRVLSAL